MKTSPSSEASIPNTLHGDRRKSLPPVIDENELPALTFYHDSKGSDLGFDLVFSERRGKNVWKTVVFRFKTEKDAEMVADSLDRLVRFEVIRPGPLLPTNDVVGEVPSFRVGTGGQSGGIGIEVAGEQKSDIWRGVEPHLTDPEEAKGLSEKLNGLLGARIIRLAPRESPLRLDEEEHWITAMTKLAGKDEQDVMDILLAVSNASSTSTLTNSQLKDPLTAPLHALDQAGIYGKDIESLFQVCRRRTGYMLAVLRATTIGLIDGPDIKAAIKPLITPLASMSAVGTLRAGGLDLNGIVKAVEAVDFAASRRVAPEPLPDIPDLRAAIPKSTQKGRVTPKDHGHGGK